MAVVVAAAGAARGERLSDKAFVRLLRAITQCELPPGEIVSEPQLEQDYGFGRVPLRLAMDRLIQLRLMRPIHRRGYQVASITLADVRQTFELRLLVEPAAVRIATATVDVAALERLQASETGPLEPGNREAEALVIDRNRTFHLLLAGACGNPKIVSVIAQTLSDIDRVYYYGLLRDARFSDMREDHLRLIDALASRDGAKAERIVRKHIETGFAIVMDAIVDSASLQRPKVQALRRS